MKKKRISMDEYIRLGKKALKIIMEEDKELFEALAKR
jgi:hypothetical protein